MVGLKGRKSPLQSQDIGLASTICDYMRGALYGVFNICFYRDLFMFNTLRQQHRG